MSEPRLISPLLDGFSMGGAMSSRSGVSCYPAMKQDSDERYIVKTISIPASQVQLDALLLAGAYKDAASAGEYFHELAEDILHEVEILDKLAAQRGFLTFTGHQLVPMEEGVGYEIYLVSPYYPTLERQLAKAPLTHLSAVNMGIDLCAALAVCREAGWLYVDVKPSNIILPGEQEFYLGDLGFVSLDALSYASLPDRCRSSYTAPEIADAYSQLNTTMDTYALGLVLYQVYNNGQLPDDLEENRKALSAPVCADEQMAQIILKACAYDPVDRYQSPSEMGHALIAYMQRNEVNNVPIVLPVAEPEPEPQAVEEAGEEVPAGPAEQDAVECESSEIPVAVIPEDPAETDNPNPDVPAEDDPAEETFVEEASVEDAPAEEPAPAEEDSAPAEEEPKEDWIDRMDAILSEDTAVEETEDDVSLRDLLTQDEDAPADISTEELSDETADMLTLAQELIEHEAPQPAVAPEPIDVPMPEPIVLTDEEPESEPEAGPADPDEEETSGEEAAASEESSEGGSSSETEPEEPQEETKPKSSIGKKLLVTALILLLLAAAALGVRYVYNNYYLQTIDDIHVEGVSQTITVQVDTAMDESLLTVVCKDTSGTTLTGTLENGQVTFSDLAPGTQYTISLEVSGYHKLVGDTSARVYYTPSQSRITGLSATIGSEDGSAIVNFGVEGSDSEEWTLTYVTEGEQEQTVIFSGHTVTLTGLTIGSTYTFTLTGDEALDLVGENTISYTASAVIYAQDITVTGYQDGTITATWSAPEGVTVSGWTARCYNEEGFDQKLDVTEASATFTDVEASAGYTIEITAAGMIQSKLVYVTATPITITDLTGTISGNSIKITWDYEGIDPAGDWLVVYTVDNGTTQNVIQTAESSATIGLIAPGSSYHITIECADSTSVFCDGITVKVPAITTAFSGYRLSASKITVTSYEAPSKNSWTRSDLGDATTTFTSGSAMALVYRTRSTYTVEYNDVVSLFVIRDADGNLAGISSRTRTWESMFEGGYCTEEIAQLPTAAGAYTLEIYVDGGLLTVLKFDIK